MVIVTGPNQDIAIKLIKRMKALFERHGRTFNSKETVIELNGCTIEAYRSSYWIRNGLPFDALRMNLSFYRMDNK